MAVNSKNVVCFVEFGTNKVATIDRKTMAINEYTLPEARRPAAADRDPMPTT